MEHKNSQALPKGCKIIKLPTVCEKRGCLAFLEEELHVPFDIKRVFWIYDVPEGETRGGHAHWMCHEVVFPVFGRFTITVDDGNSRSSVLMDKPNEGLLIPAGVWCSLEGFSEKAISVVMASEPYNAEGYVNDYEQFKAEKR